MLYTITRTLKAKKYDLPTAGNLTGAQIAAILKRKKAPAETIEIFEKYVERVQLHAPHRILIKYCKN